MPVTFGTNLIAQRTIGALRKTSKEVSTSFERLSSGQRINRGSDDPAGLYVADGLKTRTKVLNRGARNIDDGISALNVVDGTLNQIATVLQRQAELATQAANGSFSSTQRSALNQEYQALDKEIRRLSGVTAFNGINLFAGQRSTAALSTVTAASFAATPEISADGRYLTYRDSSNNLVQRDLTTNSVTTLAASVSPTLIAASASGENVAFVSTSNINGLNASSRSTVFIYNRNTGTIARANAAGAGESIENLTISADGGTVAFTSRARYASDGSLSVATGSNQNIHTYNTSSGVTAYTGVYVDTSTLFAITELALSPTGSWVGYFNGDYNNAFSYVGSFTTANPTTTNGLEQISVDDPATSVSLSISDQGLALFQSGDEADLYTYNSAHQLTQIGSGSGSLAGLVLSNDGSYFSFLSSNNLAGTGSSVLQAFRYDFETQQFTQLTANTSSTPLTASFANIISADGNTLIGVDGAGTISSANIGIGAAQLGIETGTGTRGSGAILASLAAVRTNLRGLGGHLLTTAGAARGALEAANRNIELLGTAQSTIGSTVSRLDSARRATGAQADETSAARSRIVDLDTAVEVSRLVRDQILQQATTALFAQANQVPEIALKLLGG